CVDGKAGRTAVRNVDAAAGDRQRAGVDGAGNGDRARMVDVDRPTDRRDRARAGEVAARAIDGPGRPDAERAAVAYAARAAVEENSPVQRDKRRSLDEAAIVDDRAE